jgi:flagellar biosynthesis protein FlhG
MLERLCTAIAEHGKRSLVVDASERASAHAEMALLDLAACIETLSPQVAYLAARGLPLRWVDANGSTHSFLQAVADAAPQVDVVLVHASASEHCRMFARGGQAQAVRPLLLADDRPASVTHAYAALKLLSQRAGLVVHDLLLGAAPQSPRAERIAMQLATCADDFLGAVLRDWAQLDPASHAHEPPTPALRRLVAEQLRADAPDDSLTSKSDPAWQAPRVARTGMPTALAF